MSAVKRVAYAPVLRASEKFLLHMLRLKGESSKAELARMSDMSAQGVSIIVERLLDLDLVRKGDKKRGRVGQPSTPITLNAGGAVSLGVFIGNDAAQLIAVDFNGGIIVQRHIEYRDVHSEATSRHLLSVAAEVVDSIDKTVWAKRIGIGIAARESLFRPISKSDHDEFSATMGQKLARCLEDRFEVPVHCINDIRAACLAELVVGDGKGMMNTVYINIGNTLGSGVMLEGRLIGQEIRLPSGLHSLPVPGLQGARVGDFASFASLRHGIQEAGFDFSEQVACEFADTRGVFEEWRKDAVSALALAIRSACSTIPVERVLIASRLNADDHAELLNELRFAVTAEANTSIRIPEISDSSAGPHARAMGAAIAPFFKMFGPTEKRTGIPLDRSAVA